MQKNKIIVNADDYGLTESCSLAIEKAFDKNLISSTTACANGEYIEKAIIIAKEKNFADKIGVHLNVTEGEPLTDGIKNLPFFCENGRFHGKINRYKKPTAEEITCLKDEITAQIKKLISLGINPTHVDSHHHIHTAPYLIGTVKEVSKEFGIYKMRIHRNVGKIKLYKKIGKNLFNNRLVKDGFITLNKFGNLEDFALCKNALEKFSCEIMVHPDFDVNGNLIDRAEITENGNFGAPLEKIKEIVGDKTLTSYGEL